MTNKEFRKLLPYKIPMDFVPLYSFSQWSKNEQYKIIVALSKRGRGLYRFYFKKDDLSFFMSSVEGYYPDLEKL